MESWNHPAENCALEEECHSAQSLAYSEYLRFYGIEARDNVTDQDKKKSWAEHTALLPHSLGQFFPSYFMQKEDRKSPIHQEIVIDPG